MKNRKGNILTKTVIIMIIIVLCAIFAVIAIFREYEDGVIDVVSNQQDAYVQLVLDQINLQEDRSDDEIIKNIINTLDSSTNKYWTFTKGNNILFVKNVLETNKYKGLNASTYYHNENTEKFVRSLKVNKVKHAITKIDGDAYIASGVLFKYKGGQYHLILLTNRSYILDNNKYLRAKMAMVTLISILLVLLALIPMLMAHRDRHIQLINHELEDDITSLNSSLMAADMDYQEDILYYNSDDIWNIKLLDEFIKRLKDKGHQPLSVEVKFKDEAAKADFIATAKKMVEERYIAFTDGSAVILLFSDVEEEEIKQIFQSIGVAYTALKTY